MPEELDLTVIEEALSQFQGDPFVFFEEVWGLTPQPIKQRYIPMLEHLMTTPAKYFNLEASLFTNEMFGDFNAKKHLTWQQTLLLIAVKRAINDCPEHPFPRQISVCSGKGTGKTFLVGGIMLWFMFAFPLCRVMATAPTGDQLFSVLWSELSSGIQRMKAFYRDQYIWQNKFIRMVANPAGWFARAKTSAPGEHGALAGLHSPHMLAVVDEAASVEEGVIDEARYTMTNENNLIVLISNAHTATSFFKSTFDEGSGWINIIFNAEESPIVSASTIAKVLQDCKGDREHDKYRVHVRGLFPRAGLLDNEEGWRRMYDDRWLDAFFATQSRDNTLQSPYIGVDVGGEGDDSSEIYARDAVLARHVFSEGSSTPETVAKLTIKAVDQLEADSKDVSIDNFGSGADVSAKIALLSEREMFCRGVNVGMKCEDPDDRRVYFNERARLADMLLKWGIQGGRCVPDAQLRKELESIYSKEGEGGKLHIMPKKQMKKLGLKSPNRCFVAGTKVRTTDGQKNIEEFSVGDEVVTPFGNRKVLRVYENESSDIYSVKTKSGNSLTGTGNHRVFKKNMTKVSIDKLVLGDILDTWQQKKTLPKWLSMMVRNFGLREISDITSMMSTTLNGELKKIQEEDGKFYFIDTSGKKNLGKIYLRILSSTTKTTTRSTTTSRILSAFQKNSTTKNTKKILSQDTEESKVSENTWHGLGLSQKNGTLQKKVWSGIEQTVKRFGRLKSGMKLLVKCVVWISKPLSLHVHDSALKHATKDIIIERKDTTLLERIALIAVWFLWQTKEDPLSAADINAQTKNNNKTRWWRKNVMSAESNSKANQTDYPFAQVSAIEQMKDGARKVYNLEVEKDHVYYANDILVSNCDSLWLTFAEDTAFAMRVPRGDHLYYPDRPHNDEDNSTVSEANRHRMIPL